jgi:hypothetical protein
MKRKASILMGLCVCLLLSGSAYASCDTFISTIPDGRLLSITLNASQDVGLFFNGVPGHSYSVELLEPNQGIVSMVLGQASELCPTSNASGVNLTTSIDPVLLTSRGFRGSFTATAGGSPFYTLHVVNDVASTGVQYSVSDTTLYNPRWSTFGGYTTQWGFQNTTNTTITGNLIIKTTAGSVVSNTSFDITPGVVVFKTSNGLGIAASQSGSATFTHNGPPGAIQGDTYMVSSDVKTVVPTKFEPVRVAAH